MAGRAMWALGVLGLVVVGGPALGLAAAVGGARALESRPVVGGLLLLLSLPLLWLLPVLVRDVVRARRQGPPGGVELTEAGHPKLWAEVAAAAESMWQPPPGRIVVTAGTDATATATGGVRTLAIGLPLLAGTERHELRAVLARALGGLDAAASPEARGHLFATRLPRRALLAGFRSAAAPAVRERELRADAWAARLAGTETAIDALHRVAMLEEAWRLVTERRDALPAASRPGALAGLDQALDDLFTELDELADERLASTRHPLPEGTPSYAERIAALHEDPVDPTVVPTPAAAFTLLTGGRDALAEAEAALGLAAAPHAPGWDEAAAAEVLDLARERAAALLDALSRRDDWADRSPAAVLEAVRAGRGPDLVRPMMRADTPPAQRPELACELLGRHLRGLLVARFADDGLLEITVNWRGGADVVLAADGEPWPLDGAVAAAAADPADAVPLAATARALGADLDAAVPPWTRPATAGSAAAAALTVTHPRPKVRGYRRDQAFDLLVFDDGVLVRPVPRRERGTRVKLSARARGRTAKRKAQVARVERLVDEIAGRPADWAARQGFPTRWIPWHEVSGTEWRRSLRRRPTWRVRTADGRRTTWTGTEFTARIGDPQRVADRATAARLPAPRPPGDELTSGRVAGGAGRPGR